jgi:tight adherence protein B
MGLPILLFLSVLLATFVLVLAMTRPSLQEKIVEQRMALIYIPRNKAGATADAASLLKATQAGRFDWLDKILDRYQFTKVLKRHIQQANISTTAATLILASLALYFAGYAVTWLFTSMALIDAGGGTALALVPYGIISFRRTRRISAFNEVLAESIDMMARALRSGHSVLGALEMMAESAQEPAASEFAEIFKQQNLGLPMRDSLMQLLDRVPSADLRMLVTAILVQRDTGGNLAEILDRTAFVIRERVRIQGEIQTQTAQGRLTGWILVALPVVMMILLNLMNPGYSSVLFTDPFGRKLIYFSAGMLAVGAFIIRRIVNGIEV